MEIPWNELSPEALNGVVEEFVTREATDHGHETYSLEQKMAQVLVQLRSGRARIEFDPAQESCTIVRVD
ncbi:MAG: YheU family protein [Armatimonadetes bacterium]|nr:YheU family protein [Armatimonadota bacterium]